MFISDGESSQMAFNNPGKRFQHQRQKNGSNSDEVERQMPEAKRRRTNESSSSNENGHVEGLWDDSMTFTQAELDDIDDIVLSQAVKPEHVKHKKPQVRVEGSHVGKPNVSTTEASTSRYSSHPQKEKDNTFQKPFTLSRQSSSSSSSVYPTSSSSGRSSSTSGSSLQSINESSLNVTTLSERTSFSEKVSKEEIAKLKEESVQLKNQLLEKDGEIKILRDNLRKKEEEVGNFQKDRILRIESSQREQSERERTLKAEVEKLQIQLQFKERDIQEIQAAKENLEQRASTSNENSPSRLGKNSPFARSPRFKKVLAGSDSSKSPMGFPSTQSFMSEHQVQRPQIEQRVPPVKMMDKGVMTEVKREKSSCSSRRRMRLATEFSEGRCTGSQMVANIVEVNTTLPAGSMIDRGLIDLLHCQTVRSNEQALCFDRDVSNFLSPILKRRLRDMRQMDSSPPNLLVSMENFSLSEHALSRLLSSQSSFDASSENILQFLPLINDYVCHYLDMITSFSEDFNIEGSIGSESTVSKTSSSDSSAHSLSESLYSLHKESAVYANNLEKLTRNSLQVLHKLISCSTLVCKVVLGNPSSLTPLEESGQQSCRTEASSGKQTTVESVADLNIINNICTLASILHTKPGFNRFIVQAALKVLLTLTSQATDQQLKRFCEAEMNSVLSACFHCDTVPSIIVMSLRLMHHLVKFNIVVSSMCTQRDDCLLLALYSLGCSKMAFTNQITREILHLVVSCISGICGHRGGPVLLVESNCQCSVEVVKAVILILHKVFEIYQLETSDILLDTMRKGLTLLHILFLKDNHFWDHHYEVESQYVHLINGLNLIFKQIPGNNDPELTALGDLLEQDDSEGSQDSEESGQNDSLMNE